MKKTLVLAAASLMIATAGYAQEAAQTQPQSVSTDVPYPGFVRPQAEEPASSAAAVEQEYVWQSAILRRFEGGNDTNRVDYFVPRTFTGGTTQWRGVGQIFSPRVIYPWYHDPIIYNEESQILLTGSNRFPDAAFTSDQEYVEQFKDAKSYTIDSLQFFVYRNTQGIPESNGQISVYKTGFDFTSAAYRQSGFSASRSSLTQVYARTLAPEELDTTVKLDPQSGGYTIFARREHFATETEPGLFFNAGESAIVLYSNDEAPALETLPNDADIQGVIGTLEFRSGQLTRDPNTGQITSDTRRDSLPAYKSLGVVLYKTSQGESIISAWAALLTNGRPALLNVNMIFWGVVDLTSSVKYHFGTDATTQGLGTVTPNPVTTSARLPFSLTELANVQIDLYDVNGRAVKNLVSAQRWVPGNYSVELPVNELENGAYLVRMTANDKSYSMKFTVAR